MKGPKSPRSINVKHLSAELLKEGQRLLLEGHNDACEALKYTPSDANVLAARCQCYNAQGKHAEAMRDIKASAAAAHASRTAHTLRMPSFGTRFCHS